jgi:hypothetical protein
MNRSNELRSTPSRCLVHAFSRRYPRLIAGCRQVDSYRVNRSDPLSNSLPIAGFHRLHRSEVDSRGRLDCYLPARGVGCRIAQTHLYCKRVEFHLMVHCITAALTLFAYLAGQWAVLPHAHSEVVPSHCERPHVHLTSTKVHDHDHHRDSRSGSRHSPHGDRHAPHSESPSHDQTAVYLSDEIGGVPSLQKSIKALDDVQPNWMLPIASATVLPNWLSDFSNAKTAENCCPDCPLYLSLRALRI